MGLVQDMRDVRSELALKKDLSEKMNAIVRPFVYICLNFMALRIAGRPRDMTANMNGDIVCTRGYSHLYRLIVNCP